jgi:hypothetical protein
VLHQLLNRQGPAQVHVHAGQIVHPVGVRNPLAGSQVLADLLGTTMQVANLRLDLRDDLAIGAQDQPQHTMCAGMLGSHVHEHLVRADVELDNSLVIKLG